MWIVRVALERPYTFIVLAVLLLIFGPLAIMRMPKDIFPNIGIPVVSIVWGYTGLAPQDMSDRIVANFERALTTTVNDIEHIESQSIFSTGVVKVFFQPGVNIDVALSQVTAIAQTLLRSLPPGTTPPLILTYNAASVPILQLALSSDKLSEQELFDLATNFIRTQLATVQGASIPYPYGGKQRQVMVDLNQKELQSKGLSAQDVQSAIGDQNLILPTGTEKIGVFEYDISLNASPKTIDELNDLPIKAVNGTTIYVRDVGHVRDGFAPQTNIARVDGKRATIMTIQKTGSASTLDIIQRVKERLPQIKDTAPPALNIHPIGDQSLFVRAAIEGVVREGVIAAMLTGIMILLFLGSWRSTLIIAISIPLSILASIAALYALGETLNIMTLGGLALAVGILVDDATVTIENINFHLERGKDVVQSILDGARQIAVPALVSTLCICIVFVPMFFLTGVARYLFVPLAEAVVFAMLASYGLSRTLVPTLAKFWLREHRTHGKGAAGVAAGEEESPHFVEGDKPETVEAKAERQTSAREDDEGKRSRNWLVRFQAAFERGFERFRDRYRLLLEGAVERRALFAGVFLAVVLASFLLFPLLGEDFFPTVDAGQMKLHLRAHVGTRVEETARLCDEVEDIIRRLIPPAELENITDIIGPPVSGINLSYSNSAPIGPSDADIMISLNSDHRPVADYQRALRTKLPRKFPGVNFAFLPADMVGQILNFGLPAPIDVQIAGANAVANRKYARQLFGQIEHVPGIVDLHFQQAYDYPTLDIDVDRTRAQELGMTELNVANNMLISLAGSFQTAPSFYLNPQNGVSYNVVTQTPQYSLDSLQALDNLPITGATNSQPQILGGLATVHRDITAAVVSHYNVQPVIDLYAGVQDSDLGAVANNVNRILKETAKDVPKGSLINARGQMQTMASSFAGLYSGLAFAIVLAYLLIVVNFQSWLDPFIIVTALPGALAGIVWMLFATHTTLSVPALTGAIMCMGVATANSILIVSFARERIGEGDDAVTAAIQAGYTRLRPVLMTALAMIIGMAPMALGLGEGGEENAPLGRAVIGGLTFATFGTLFFVPVVFALFHAPRSAQPRRGTAHAD